MYKSLLTRNDSIDCMRFIGLSLIILAHINPPYILFNLRCFDVPMMLFISGLVYSGRKIDLSLSFFIKRALRLVVPVYIFLTVYFLLAMVLKFFAGIDFGITYTHIIGSYALFNGIGYVWIIRVFLLIALLTPLLMRIEQYLRSDWALVLFMVALSLMLTASVQFGFAMNNVFVKEYLYYAIGYSVPFIAGLRVMHINKTRFKSFSYIIASIMLLLCGIRTIYGGGVLNIQGSKYPPQAYFLFFGVLMSLLCYAVCFYMKLGNGIYRLFRFIGMNTIWIYLYHIPFIQLTGKMSMHWSLRYIIVYAFSVVMCYVQICLVNKLSAYRDRKIYRYLKG